MTVLIVAGEGDRTANGVVRGLGARGVDVARIDTGWFPQRLTLDAEFANGRWVGELRTFSRVITLDELRAIWYRSPTTFELPEGMSSAERQYARREGKLGLGGVLTALPVLAVNDPHNCARAVYKPLQQRKRRIRIPETWPWAQQLADCLLAALALPPPTRC